MLGCLMLYFDFRDTALDLLSTISISTPQHIQEQTLPHLLSLLPDQAPPREGNLERVKYWRVLSALGKICVQKELFETFVIRLTTKLDLLCIPVASSTSRVTDIEPIAAYAHSILATLAKTLATKVNMKHTDVPKYLHSLVPRLYNLFLRSALSDSDNMATADHRLVSLAAQIVTLVVQALSLKSVFVFRASIPLVDEMDFIGAKRHLQSPSSRHIFRVT
jgi:DNA repair/transcription protein MET18/MMS19